MLCFLLLYLEEFFFLLFVLFFGNLFLFPENCFRNRATSIFYMLNLYQLYKIFTEEEENFRDYGVERILKSSRDEQLC